MKNKFIKLILLSIAMVSLLTGCSSSKETVNIDTNEKLKIVTSFYPMYILTSNVAKDINNVEVINLTKPYTGCLHDYSITTNEMKILENSDVFVINGAGMESFMDKIIKQMPKLNIIEASEGIELLEAGCEETNDENHEHNVNPHVWLSVSKAIEQVKNIESMLSNYDKPNKDKYKKNAEEYIAKLETLKEEMHNSLDNIEDKNIITFHESFPYFAEEFDLNIVGVIEREPGSQPNAKELQETIKLIKSLDVKAIFTEPQYPTKVAETISKETGVKIYTLDPIVTGEMDLDSYINIMEENLKTLKEALK